MSKKFSEKELKLLYNPIYSNLNLIEIVNSIEENDNISKTIITGSNEYNGILIKYSFRKDLSELLKMNMQEYLLLTSEGIKIGESVVFQNKNSFLDKGFDIILGDGPEDNFFSICIIKTTGKYDVLSFAKTDGANYDLKTTDIIQKLQSWESLVDFWIISAGQTGCLLYLLNLPDDIDGFIKDLLLFCPDAKEAVPIDLKDKYLVEVEHEINGEKIQSLELTEETLKQVILDTRKIYLWWD